MAATEPEPVYVYNHVRSVSVVRNHNRESLKISQEKRPRKSPRQAVHMYDEELDY